MRHNLKVLTVLVFCLFIMNSTEAEEVFDPIVITPPSKAITKAGQNRQPVFVSDDTILFVSRDRAYHKDPQIYFKDLRTGRERRITHQRGHIINGAWMEKKNLLLYASTTDEEKETPPLLKKYVERFPSSIENDDFFHVNLSPSEIYMSELDGTGIKRLSEHSGFDAFPSYLESKNQVLFSRWDENNINIYAQSTKKNLNPWKVMKTKGHDLGLQLSPKKDQFVWSRFSPDFKTSQLMLTEVDFKEPQFITLDSGINWSPTWHPNGETVIYSSKMDNARNFDLYEVSVAKGCKRKITSFEGDEFYPVVSPDGKSLLFTSTLDGGEQIHQLSYPTPFQCD